MDNLATLASMGFDIEECEIVLQEENITIQEAIQRLLVRQTVNAERTEKKNPRRTELTSEGLESEHQGAAKFQNADLDSKNGENVVSRFAMSERQQALKLDFEKKMQKEAEVSAKRRKLQDRNVKEFVRKEIEANKKHVQEMRCKPSLVSHSGSSSSASQAATESGLKSESTVISGSKCRIQVRLPTGRVMNGEFSAEDCLDVVMERALQDVSCDVDASQSAVLMQPFPRKEFSTDDLVKSLKDLGLCPNSSLVFLSKRSVEQQGSSQIVLKANTVDQNQCGAATKVRTVHSDTPRLNTGHSWGDGMSLAGSLQSQDKESSASNDQNSKRADIQKSSLLNAVLSNSDYDRDAATASGSFFNGSIADLDELKNADDATRKNTNDATCRNALIEAAERRADAPVFPAVPSKTKTIAVFAREISTLASSSADAVAKCLAAQNGSVLSAVGKSLSQNAACQVIHALKNRKLLTGKLLNLLHPCKLSQLNLNFYTLASNEILEAARLHSTLTVVCLSQCSLITDNGVITAVRGLKSLQVLDLCGCVQVTDRSLHEIQELPYLRTLKLDNTKVKDFGLLQFLRHSNRTSLLDLSLNATKVTLNAFPTTGEELALSVTSLSLNRTDVVDLKFLSSFKELRHLSLSGTGITSDSFQNMKQLRNLNELNLNYTKIKDDDLQYIQGMPIGILGLPDRLVISNAGLKFIEDLPLTELDLSDYILISDAGLGSVGRIESLRSLSLANTKITDQGLLQLSNLRKLQDFDIAKTHIGDEGIKNITGLRSIQTLSLANTRITNVCLENGHLNRFDNLFKLNISGNKVSTPGIRHLRLPCLEMINADKTYININAVDLLHGCPNLKVIRAQNCRPESELDN